MPKINLFSIAGFAQSTAPEAAQIQPRRQLIPFLNHANPRREALGLVKE
jgi:hypothetical protein